MKQLNRKNVFIILGMSGLLLGLYGCSRESDVIFVDPQDNLLVSETVETVETVMPVQTVSVNEQETEPQIVVHICGAVKSPGVYRLDLESHVIDAVESAGGLLENAAPDYVNLADGLEDGDKIWIPTEEEVGELLQDSSDFSHLTSSATAGIDWSAGESDSKKVNINTADQELLCTLPGIGETRADSIVAYREAQGGFASIEEIMNVSGIKDSSFQKIKEYIVVK